MTQPSKPSSKPTKVSNRLSFHPKDPTPPDIYQNILSEAFPNSKTTNESITTYGQESRYEKAPATQPSPSSETPYPHHWYMLTIKCAHAKYITRQQTLRILTDIKKKVKYCNWPYPPVYEIDSLNKWHLHIVFQSRYQQSQKFIKKRNWTTNLMHFPHQDLHQVMKYTQKTPQDLITLQKLDLISQTHYHFKALKEKEYQEAKQKREEAYLLKEQQSKALPDISAYHP